MFFVSYSTRIELPKGILPYLELPCQESSRDFSETVVA